MTTRQPTVDSIIDIIRRDLKLGPDVALSAETELFGGELDLDSLDALLLVQSVQKAFDVRIPTDAIGPDIFATIETFTRFVQGLGHTGSAHRPSTHSPRLAEAELLDRLPHRPPFRFITGNITFDSRGAGRGLWRVTGDEPFLEGHFPGDPVVPGVLIGEALAQLCGLILISRAAEAPSTVRTGRLAHIDLRFDRAITPPADIVLEGRPVQTVGALRQFEVRALTDATPAAHGTLALATPETPAENR